MPEGTYLAWLDCRAMELAEPASWFVEHAKVGLGAGAGYGAVGAGHLRLNFATSRDVLRRLVESMGDAMRRHCHTLPV
jgi:cystathionine beta-lyase